MAVEGVRIDFMFLAPPLRGRWIRYCFHPLFVSLLPVLVPFLVVFFFKLRFVGKEPFTLCEEGQKLRFLRCACSLMSKNKLNKNAGVWGETLCSIVRSNLVLFISIRAGTKLSLCSEKSWILLVHTFHLTDPGGSGGDR